MTAETTTYACSPDVAMTEVADTGGPVGVLLHLGSRRYFTLNATGVFIWNLLSKAPRSADAIADEVVRAFAVERAGASASIGGLLAELSSEGLIEPQR